MAETTHLLGLPRKHSMKDIKDLADELAKYLLVDGSRAMTGNLLMGGNNISSVGHITPITTGTYNMGSDTLRFNAVKASSFKGDQFDLSPASTPEIWMVTGFPSMQDLIRYDKTNNRFLFIIGGQVRGYVDANGFHDGAPP